MAGDRVCHSSDILMTGYTGLCREGTGKVKSTKVTRLIYTCLMTEGTGKVKSTKVTRLFFV